MANEAHCRILEKGAALWNQWRRENTHQLDLSEAVLVHANLSGANLVGVDLSDADFTDADLRGANFSKANLKGTILVCAILAHADLRGANLVEANLSLADLSGADLRGANFVEAELIGADLSRADLSGADLSGADLSGINLTGANLSGANLGGATLKDVDLSSSNLGYAKLAGTTFGNCDLRMVEGLDSVEHLGPSTVGLDTIYKSGGDIPESFLRGCGVPESFITQMRSLVGAEGGIQFYSCFISYSHEDEEFAKRLHERMRRAKLRVWFAREDMEGGKKIHKQIETQIHVHDKLLLVLSENSMQSDWVATEIYHARRRERRERRQILFPIRLCTFEAVEAWESFDADTGKDMAREIREYFIPDFSGWKDHDQFEAGFAKLLNDLRPPK